MFIEFVLDTFQRCFNSENFWIGVPSILFYSGGLKKQNFRMRILIMDDSAHGHAFSAEEYYYIYR